MTNEQLQVKTWMQAYGQETPEKPCIPSSEIRKLRAKLILEEALETIDALGIGIFCHKEHIHHTHEFTFFDHITPNLKEIADGCVDLKVVTEGTLVACGLIDKKQTEYYPGNNQSPHICGIDLLFDEVMRSNNTKFWKYNEIGTAEVLGYSIKLVSHSECHHPNMDEARYLVKDKDGKVIKSPSYSPPNLQPIIDSL